MRGPTPKPAALRQRRNRVSTAATLSAENAEGREIPPLPATRRWHKLTMAWWEDIWRSPMAPEYLESDIHGLYLLAELINRFWRKPTVSLAAEIRQHRTCFGLTPIDRRRLQWEVNKVEQAQRKSPAPPVLPPAPADDPRRLLTVVQ